MILSDIKQYLQQRGQASLGDIAIHFDSSPDAVRGMLDIWIRKGKVRKRMANSACGDSCNQCDGSSTEIYQWLDSARTLKHIPIIPERCDKA